MFIGNGGFCDFIGGFSTIKIYSLVRRFWGEWSIDWHVDAGTWEVGTTTSGPGKAFTGDNCAATILNGNYSQPVSIRLIRHTAILVTAASQNPRFRFWYWFSYATNDWGEVQITIDDGIIKETISNQFINTSSETRTPFYISLSSYANL